jgi:lysine/ornithine N-monooxygenase
LVVSKQLTIFTTAKAMKPERKKKKMRTFNLNNKPVTLKTHSEIVKFVYENRFTIGNEQKMFYSDVQRIMEQELRKLASRRLTMSQIMERAYNIDAYILASGAAEVTTEFIN